MVSLKSIGRNKMKKVIGILQVQLNILPCELEEIFSIEEMETELGVENTKDLLSSIFAINEVILVDKEYDYAECLGEFSFNIIGVSLGIIRDKTTSRPDFVKEVIEMFHLSDFLVIPDELLKDYS